MACCCCVVDEDHDAKRGGRKKKNYQPTNIQNKEGNNIADDSNDEFNATTKKNIQKQKLCSILSFILLNIQRFLLQTDAKAKQKLKSLISFLVENILFGG